MSPTPPEREILLQALRSARAHARVPQSRIAKRVGLSRMSIGRIESGQQSLTPRILRTYAAMCGLDAPRLLLSWGIIPEEVLTRLQQNPHLLDLVLNS